MDTETETNVNTVIEHMNDVFTLLKNPKVRVMLNAMRLHGGMSVTTLSEVAGVSQPNVSFYMKRLKRAGVVEMTRIGARHIYYLANSAEARFVKWILDYLTMYGYVGVGDPA
jgi:DNA-binding transcriptional ArsR family regulator